MGDHLSWRLDAKPLASRNLISGTGLQKAQELGMVSWYSVPGTHKPVPNKLGLMVHACNPSTRDEEQEIRSSSSTSLHSEFQDILNYVRFCLPKGKEQQ